MTSRRIAPILLIALVGSLLVAQPAQAATVTNTIGGITYQADDANVGAGATVVGTVAVGLTAVIPAVVTIDGTDYAVTSIGAFAFNGAGITSVVIPNSVTSIGDYAFESNALATVSIPGSVTTIGQYAFAYSGLTSLTLNEGLVTIGGNAFLSTNLGSVTIPDSVTAIDSYAFYYAGLTSVDLGTGVAIIGEGAFTTNSIVSLVIPDSVISTGTAAFSNNSLTSLQIGSGLTMIVNNTFGSNYLTTVTIPDTVTYIDLYAFAHNSLTSVDLGTGVTNIGSFAFAYNGLGTVAIPDSVSHIRPYAFYDNLLTSVTIGTGIVLIDDWAFDSNSGLADITFAGDAPAVGSFALGTWDPLVTYFNGATGFTTPLWDTGSAIYRTRMLSTVTFSANGHGTAPDAELVAQGGTVAYPGALSAVGYVFDGWFTAASAGTAVSFPYLVSSDVTLYAQWLVTSNLVSFDSANGDDVVNYSITYDTAAWAPGVPALAGHTFTGWFTAASGGVSFDFSTHITAPLTLYAQWDVNDYTVTFAPGNGGPGVDVVAAYGTDVAALAAPTRVGFRFGGWFAAPTGGSTLAFPLVVADDVTVYGQWLPLAPAINAPSQAQAGTTITITGVDFAPGETVELWLLSAPVRVATATADADGAFSVTVTIPADTGAGAHTLEARGATSGTVSAALTLSGVLASTGADMLGDAALALALVTLGFGMIRRRRAAVRA